MYLEVAGLFPRKPLTKVKIGHLESINAKPVVANGVVLIPGPTQASSAVNVRSMSSLIIKGPLTG